MLGVLAPKTPSVRFERVEVLARVPSTSQLCDEHLWRIMIRKNEDKRSPSFLSRMLALFVGIVIVLSLFFNLYRPDSPLPKIPTGTSSEPTFVVQVIRPWEGLPFGGLLPPELLGVDARLGFDSATEGAKYRIGEERIELSADGWELTLVFDMDGRVTAETEIVFKLVFEDRNRTVRCRPGDLTIGKLKIDKLEETGELSGYFDIELSNCEDAETGKPLGWPPRPFVLHGSFDRLGS